MATYGQVLVNTQSGVGEKSPANIKNRKIDISLMSKGNDVPSLREKEGATTRETAGKAGEGSIVGASEMASRSAKQLRNELKK